MARFYGEETAAPEVLALYDRLWPLWRIDTCAPRLRPDWTPENRTLGQCSITAFLVQDLLGGKVYGVPLADGSVHCFNEALGCVFDLTSAQFGEEKLDYAGKRARYELLKSRLLSAKEAQA